MRFSGEVFRRVGAQEHSWGSGIGLPSLEPLDSFTRVPERIAEDECYGEFQILKSDDQVHKAAASLKELRRLTEELLLFLLGSFELEDTL